MSRVVAEFVGRSLAFVARGVQAQQTTHGFQSMT